MPDIAIRRDNTAALRIIGDYAGPCALAAFGVALWLYNLSENVFSFIGWGTLDLVVGIGMYKAGSKREARLPIAYGVIAFFVVLAILKNGEWTWGIVENVCLIGFAVSLIGWWKGGPLFAVVMGNVTMFIASIPILVDNYYAPHHWEWWLWIGSLTSATIGLYLTYPWKRANIADWSFVATSETVTIAMLYLIVIR